MIYDAELVKGQPPTVSIHPPVPEQSLYLYPRTPGISHNLHAGEISNNLQSIIVGPMVERVNLSIGYNHLVIRIGFQPGGLHRLLGLPAHELFNQPLDGQDLFGYRIRELNEQLALATNFWTMKNIVKAFLLKISRQVKEQEKLDT